MKRVRVDRWVDILRHARGHERLGLAIVDLTKQDRPGKIRVLYSIQVGDRPRFDPAQAELLPSRLAITPTVSSVLGSVSQLSAHFGSWRCD